MCNGSLPLYHEINQRNYTIFGIQNMVHCAINVLSPECPSLTNTSVTNESFISLQGSRVALFCKSPEISGHMRAIIFVHANFNCGL